jgi:hypothetical protein
VLNVKKHELGPNMKTNTSLLEFTNSVWTIGTPSLNLVGKVQLDRNVLNDGIVI